MDAKHFHIFGVDIAQSLSPTTHNAGFAHYDLPYRYDIRETSNIEDVADLIIDSHFGGASVTMPHKLRAHIYCDRQNDAATRIGATNTLVVKQERTHEGITRRIEGHNTDWEGLHSRIFDWSSKQERRRRIGLVIGAGGTGRAALYAMDHAGIDEIWVCNRSVLKAERVAKDFKDLFPINVAGNLSEPPNSPDIIIGTIPGDAMSQESFEMLFKKPTGLCIDMAYKPRVTPLLSVASRHSNWVTADGLEVVLRQGFAQFQPWTAKPAPEVTMGVAVQSASEPLPTFSKNIVVGESTSISQSRIRRTATAFKSQSDSR